MKPQGGTVARNLEELKRTLGFPGPWSSRLDEALTHRSYAVENNLAYDNQRLEFLGDAVLEIILTEYLFNLYPDAPEGEMTKMRSALVREAALARLARKLRLGDYLRTGRGERDAGGADRDSTLADLFEAVLGAFYLDAGFDVVRDFILRLAGEEFPDPRSQLTTLNPKGLLQEYSQRRWGTTPEYQVLHTSGPEHLPIYDVEVHLHGYIATGRAASRKHAESEAAKSLYHFLVNQEKCR